jgi:hypothetical protein
MNLLIFKNINKHYSLLFLFIEKRDVTTGEHISLEQIFY